MKSSLIDCALFLEGPGYAIHARSCVVLCCAVLYCIALCCVVLCCVRLLCISYACHLVC